jgi:hypothetical protein
MLQALVELAFSAIPFEPHSCPPLRPPIAFFELRLARVATIGIPGHFSGPHHVGCSLLRRPRAAMPSRVKAILEMGARACAGQLQRSASRILALYIRT